MFAVRTFSSWISKITLHRIRRLFIRKRIYKRGIFDKFFKNMHFVRYRFYESISLQIYPQKLLPVLVYIHGGAFRTGNGITNGPHLFMDKSIVFVSFNHRLGVFGEKKKKLLKLNV